MAPTTSPSLSTTHWRSPLATLLKKLNLDRATITRDLTVGLLLVIALVFAGAGTANYFYSVDRDTKALYDKATEVMDNLALVLGSPMWNLNTEELHKVVDIYRQSGIVLDINVTSDSGEELVKPSRATDQSFLEMTRIIYHQTTPIGRLTVYFSNADIQAKQRQMAGYTLAIFTFLTTSLIIATTFLLRRFVTKPFLRITDGLSVISGGNYEHRFAPVKQVDINDITAKVMLMAGEIAKREAALEHNRYKLEILNEAILVIFSCSDTRALLQTTLQLAHKICGTDLGWFYGEPGTGDGEGATTSGQTPPEPLLCTHGEIAFTTASELRPYLERQAEGRLFSFPIKSRSRTVGTMSVEFNAVPDAAVTSLLKSLMSLASMAMVRQSFIRETAYIAAELQVAETVQRSMLLDSARVPRNANVSYHYEPVLRVGGDWFSVIESSDGGSLYVILGDVTGHGLAQGLVTTAMAGALSIVEALIQGSQGLQAETAAPTPTTGQTSTSQLPRPSQIVTLLDNVVRKLADKSNLRMTCVAAKIDFHNMCLTVCNAGHTFPLLLHQHQHGGDKIRIESLAKSQQSMLGDDGRNKLSRGYYDAEYSFHKSDLLLFYTDGLTEALDKDGKSFLRKFQRYFSRMETPHTVNILLDELLASFRTHTENVPVKDDICLLIVGEKNQKAVEVA